MKQITSVQNPFIKSLVQLQEKAKVRKQTGTFLIEGQREIELALKGGYELETILFLPEIISEREILRPMASCFARISSASVNRIVVLTVDSRFFSFGVTFSPPLFQIIRPDRLHCQYVFMYLCKYVL